MAASVAALIAWGLACSSSSDDDDDGSQQPGGAAYPGAYPGSVTGADVFQPGATPADLPPSNGGFRELTPAEVEQMRNQACVGRRVEPEPLPSALMMVIDVSSSMGATTPATGNRTKWEVTREALLDAVRALPPATAVGALLYPNMDTGGGSIGAPRNEAECVNADALVPVALLGGETSSHRQAINEMLAEADLNLSTPTHDAYYTALQAFQRAGFGGGSSFLLLITDGQPTLSRGCVALDDTLTPVEEEPIITEVQAAHAAGFRTFIIGSPGSEGQVRTGIDGRPWLSRAAETGGTAPVGCTHAGVPRYCHFDMTEVPDFDQSLRQALGEISGHVVQCSYALPSPEPGETLDAALVNLILTLGNGVPTVYGRNDAANCDVGWQYSANGGQVVLCSETCELAMSDANAQLEILFGCETEQPDIV
jgi:hypothetical protein